MPLPSNFLHGVIGFFFYSFFLSCSGEVCPGDGHHTVYIKNHMEENPADFDQEQCIVYTYPIAMADIDEISKKEDYDEELDKAYVHLDFDFKCTDESCGPQKSIFIKDSPGFSISRSSFTISNISFDPVNNGDYFPFFHGFYRTKCYEDERCDECNDDGLEYHSFVWEFTNEDQDYEYTTYISNGTSYICNVDLTWTRESQVPSCHCTLKYAPPSAH